MSVKRAVRHAFYCFCRQLSMPALITLTGARYFDVPDIRKVRGGLLIASNHQSYLDPVLVGMALSRPISYVARSSLFRTPAFSHLIRALGAHALTRGKADGSGLRTIIALLQSGEALLMFPEGTRTRDGSLGQFRAGVGSLAARCGVPLLPVCIEGAYRCWPRDRALPRPARAAVAFGRLMWPESLSGRELTRQLASEIGRLQRFVRGHLKGDAPSS